MTQLILRKLSSPVLLISAFALMVALSLPLQQRLRSIPSMSPTNGSIQNMYNQSELTLALTQVDLYLDIPRVSRITPYLVTAKIATKGISTHYITNKTDSEAPKELVIVIPPPIISVLPTDNSNAFTIRESNASVAYRKGLSDFGLIYAKRKALQEGLLEQANSYLQKLATESEKYSNTVIHIDTDSWETPLPPAINITGTRFSLYPDRNSNLSYNTNYTSDKLSYYFANITDNTTSSTLTMSLYDIDMDMDMDTDIDKANTETNNTPWTHNTLRTYDGKNMISISFTPTGFNAMIKDDIRTYLLAAQSPSPSDFSSFLPVALNTISSLRINTNQTNIQKSCTDIFQNNIDAWLNSDAISINDYVKGLLLSKYFNPDKIFQTVDIQNTTVLYDSKTLDEYQGNIRQLTIRLQNIGQSNALTQQTANFALYSKNALANNEDIYILFLKTRAYVYVYDNSGNNILNKTMNFYQLPNNYKVVIDNQSSCSSGRLYKHEDDMFCFSKTYVADFIDKLINDSFVALFKCGL